MGGVSAGMDKGVGNMVEPPPSQYPGIANNQLVDLSALRFPNIHGVVVPTRPQRAYHVDYGPDFRTRGIISIEPPQVGKPFPTLVPQEDADRNEPSAIRTPDIHAPPPTTNA